MEVKLNHISKSYGNKLALDAISVQLKPGIVGLLGANGSGKTTLLRILATVLPMDEGSIEFDSINIQDNLEGYLSNIGYMPQHLGLYPNFRVDEFLEYMGTIKGLTKAYTKNRIHELLELVNLTDVRKKKIRTLSGGMKQRLGIAQALLNDPKILILDEPTVGLDPKERNHFSRILAEISQSKIIILSTHIVSDVEFIANSILLLKEGHILAHDTPTHLLEQMPALVKEEIIPTYQMMQMEQQFTICSQKATDEGMLVRYLDPLGKGKGTIVKATLNDLYLFYFAGGE